MSDMPYVGVIEWDSDAAEAPTVIVGATAHIVRARAVAPLRNTECNDAPDFHQETPVPDLMDEAAVMEWHRALREATTVPWFTLYAHPALELDDLTEYRATRYIAV